MSVFLMKKLKKAVLQLLKIPFVRGIAHIILTLLSSTRTKTSDMSKAQARQILEQVHPKPSVGLPAAAVRQAEEKYDVSIIVPAYNVEKEITCCIDSIVNQKTNYSFEVIIINDGSTDKTGELLEQYRHYDFVWIEEQENRGFSGARNRGLELARGRYLMFIDSDDYIPKDAVESLMKTAVANDADIVQGSFCNVVGGQIEPGATCKNAQVNVADTNQKIFGYVWGKVFKKQLFASLSFPEQYWFEDTITHYLLVFLAKRIFTIQEFVYFYRLNPKGITSVARTAPKSVDTYWICEYLQEIAEQLNLPMALERQAFLIRHFSNVSKKRLQNLDPTAQEAFFVLAGEFMRSVQYQEDSNLNVFYKQTRLLLLNKQYEKWKLYGSFVT